MSYNIKNNELIITKKFNIGEVVKITEDENNETVDVLVTVDTEYGQKIMKESLINHVKKGQLDKIDSVLEEYFKYRLLEQLGITHYPVIERNGKLEGLKEK